MAGVPFVSLPSLRFGVPVEPFGLIVAVGMLVGARVLGRHARRHGVADDDVLVLTASVMVVGFVGAHAFEVLMYERAKLARDPWVLLRLWDGISSYGGFLGGALAWAVVVRSRRLPAGVTADATMIGLLVAFSIGRVGCTLVHDHIGRETGFWLGTDYPRAELAARGLLPAFPGAGDLVRAHNLGLYELLLLLPLNAVILWLAFQRRHRLPAGLLAVSIALFYAPLRFALEFLRLEVSDPRHAGLTFAQWGSIVALVAAAISGNAIRRYGRPAPRVGEPLTTPARTRSGRGAG